MIDDLSDQSRSKQNDSSVLNLLYAFGHDFTHSLEAPGVGLSQVLGSDSVADNYLPSRAQDSSGAEHWSSVAGSVCGSATLYLGTSFALSLVPGVGKIAPLVTGAVLGFLEPLPVNDSIARLANAGIGATTMGLVSYGPQIMSGLGFTSRFLTNDLTMTGLAGLFDTESRSYINTGHAASLGEATLGAASWLAGGLVFNRLIPAATSYARWTMPNYDGTSYGRQYGRFIAGDPAPAGTVAIPTLALGEDPMKLPTARALYVDAASEKGRFYEDNKQASVRIRTRDGAVGSGGIISADQGLIGTAAHVALREMEFSRVLKVELFDGQTLPAKILAVDTLNDSAILKLEGPWPPLKQFKLGALDDVTAQRPLYLLSHPQGARPVFMNEGHVQDLSGVKELFHEFETTIASTRGSSGGAILAPDGTWVGMLTRGKLDYSHSTSVTTESLQRLLNSATGPSSTPIKQPAT